MNMRETNLDFQKDKNTKNKTKTDCYSPSTIHLLCDDTIIYLKVLIN